MEQTLKSYFPALQNDETVYLDSASSCQVPQRVIDSISKYLSEGHGNAHRGMYPFSEKAESLLFQCREKLAHLLNTRSKNILLTKSTTESINLVANSFRNKIEPGQTLLTTLMEHHANLLPWQRLCEQTGAKLDFIGITEQGYLDLNDLEEKLANNCALFAFSHNSNVLGTTNPVAMLTETAQKFNVPTLIDGAQAIAHQLVDLRELSCDFYALSGHKIYGPTGIGALYVKQPKSLSPLLLGGGIVTRVKPNGYNLTDDITQFEAGTPNMLGIAGLVAALEFFFQQDREAIFLLERQLTEKLIQVIESQNYRVVSDKQSNSLVSFVSPQFHSHDIASVLADQNIAVRAGHHCAQPCLSAIGVKQCVRVSVGMYTTDSDIDRFEQGLKKVSQILV
ncbi:MAG: cysteine desulfurase [Kangiellaceae bacterium]|nr:cysteine desulfurase [Kangiellaceae bacterium]MCW9000481.1 cysteine desulfurase [Kangiellaceae bacterium]